MRLQAFQSQAAAREPNSSHLQTAKALQQSQHRVPVCLRHPALGRGLVHSFITEKRSVTIQARARPLSQETMALPEAHDPRECDTWENDHSFQT